MSPSSDTNKSSTTNNGATNKKRISENSCDGYFKRAKIGEEVGSQGNESPNQSLMQGGEDSNSTSFSLDESSNTCVNIGEVNKNQETAGSQLLAASNSAALTKEDTSSVLHEGFICTWPRQEPDGNTAVFKQPPPRLWDKYGFLPYKCSVGCLWSLLSSHGMIPCPAADLVDENAFLLNYLPKGNFKKSTKNKCISSILRVGNLYKANSSHKILQNTLSFWFCTKCYLFRIM